jgi:hypothetical protein
MKDINSTININNKNNIKNNIFREFIKNNDIFVATNNFYSSEEGDDGKFIFSNINNNNNEKFFPFNEKDVFIIMNNNSVSDKYVDLLLLSKITLSLDDTYINRSELIKNIIANDLVIDEKLFEDLYFNEEFSKKINVELPKKYNDKKIILEDIDIEKKYLFKINILECNRIFYQYKE